VGPEASLAGNLKKDVQAHNPPAPSGIPAHPILHSGRLKRARRAEMLRLSRAAEGVEIGWAGRAGANWGNYRQDGPGVQTANSARKLSSNRKPATESK
jgi:hypothetical protein